MILAVVLPFSGLNFFTHLFTSSAMFAGRSLRARAAATTPSPVPPAVPAVPPLRKLLVANRGEIACRIFRTARALGLKTVAVYSDADVGAQHVALADEAIRVGPAEGPLSYLRPDRIVEAALRSGASAVHPGYGFLSENADFAAALAAAGVGFVGPPAAAIRAMGSKAAAKDVMLRAGVPVTPGYWGEDATPERFASEAAAIGYPIMLKAVRGGGGKGMRIVRSAAELPAALDACRREAATSFGSSAVLIEKYLPRPRHVEFQVLADTHGNVVHLFERDCSVQRRHQKVLEEAPAPFLPLQVREAMGCAAVEAAAAVGYVGAGTVEFMVDAEALAAKAGAPFYFMEMNCRLQVEHPVTEMILGGLDLVELQLRIAAGECLPFSQADLAKRVRGHAIEARVYAENPLREFLPATGLLRHLAPPPSSRASVPSADFTAVAGKNGAGFGLGALPYVRVDTGVRAGDSVSVYYDPMISKLIAWGETRAAALDALSGALAAYQVVGVPNNLAFLQRVVAHPAFAKGAVDTSFLTQHLAECLPPSPSPPTPATVVACAALASALATLQRTTTGTGARAGAPSAGSSSSSPYAPGATAGRLAPMQPASGELRFAFVEIDDGALSANPPRAVSVTPAAGASAFRIDLGESGVFISTGTLEASSGESVSALACDPSATTGREVAGTSSYDLVVTLAREGVDAPAVRLRATVVFTGARAGGTEVHIFPRDPALMTSSHLVDERVAGGAGNIAASSTMPPPSHYTLVLPAPSYGRAGAAAANAAQRIIAPMPGKIIKVLVAPGEKREAKKREEHCPTRFTRPRAKTAPPPPPFR